MREQDPGVHDDQVHDFAERRKKPLGADGLDHAPDEGIHGPAFLPPQGLHPPFLRKHPQPDR